MKKYYIYPGKFFTSSEETDISTILGSCVGVALHDSVTQVGGLNHYLLPRAGKETVLNARYGEYAIPALISAMESLGASKKRLEAKIYGGASVLAEVSQDIEIGKRNIELAEKMLADLNIPILEKNVGGLKGRKIHLNSKTFEVSHRFISSDADSVDLSGQRKLTSVKSCRVLIVDDSATVRNLFQKIFQKAGLQIVGVAANPYEARELIVKTKPDVITLDIEMPMMNGVTFLEKLMQHYPIPVVMVSSLGSQGTAALRAMELGAVEFVQKPSQFELDKLQYLAESLVEKIRAAASMTVVQKSKLQSRNQHIQYAPTNKINQGQSIAVIGVSGNAGSQVSLEKFLLNLPSDTPPIVIANATISTFLNAYIEKLKSKVKVGLYPAVDGGVLKMGNAYFSPAGVHLEVKPQGGALYLHYQVGVPVFGQLPSGSVLFESIADSAGSSSIGILMSGFGTDGVDGLQKIQAKGGVTMVENPESCAFPYGPQAAISQGVADAVLDMDQMSESIMELRNRKVA